MESEHLSEMTEEELESSTFNIGSKELHGFSHFNGIFIKFELNNVWKSSPLN